MMMQGQYDQSELRQLDSQHMVTHNQLLEITNMTRDEDMYAYALMAARGSNQQ
jgi:hypothetical protein